MGKLTDSLKDTSKQLSKVKDGLRQMQALGEGIADNAQAVAEAGLRTGYAYAKVEAARTEVAQAEAALSESDAAPESWTLKSLKSEFGSATKAYAHLKKKYGVTLRSRSWANILAAFNEGGSVAERGKDRAIESSQAKPPKNSHPPNYYSLENRVAELEQLTQQQAKKIAVLEAKLDSLLKRDD